MENKKNKSFIIVTILFVFAITFMTVGFAAYRKMLTINGTATLKPDGNIYIKSVTLDTQNTTESAIVDPAPYITQNGSVSFNLSFRTNNDENTQYQAVYNIVIANESSYDYLYNIPDFDPTIYKDGVVYHNLVECNMTGIAYGETIPAYSEKTITATFTFTNPDIENTGLYEVNGEFIPDLKENTRGRLIGSVNTSTIGDLTGSNTTATFTVNVMSTYDTEKSFTIIVADTNKYIATNNQKTISANNTGQDFTFGLQKANGSFEFNSEIESVKILIVPTGEEGVNAGTVSVRVDTNGPRDTVAPVISNVVVAIGDTDGNVTVSWNATDNAGNGALYQYTAIAYRKTGPNTYERVISKTVNNTTSCPFTFTENYEKETYYFTVYGRDTSGNTATAGEIQSAQTTPGHACRSVDTYLQWEFTVTFNVTGTINHANGETTTAKRGTDFVTTISQTGNGNPNITSITMGGNEYTNYSQNGTTLTIRHPITGDIVISVTQGQTCLVEGTKILLSDGSYKNIEDIKYTDLLKVYDHVNGGVTNAYPIWIEKEQKGEFYKQITFSDGTDLKIVNNHYIFDVDKKMYIDAGNSEQCKVGTRIYKWENNNLEIVTVVNIENKKEPVKFYNVISTNYYNIIANDVITTDPTTAFSNIYGFKEDAIYSNKFYEVSKEQEMPYTLVSTFMPYYLYKGLNLKNAMFLINNKNITYSFLFDAVSDRTVEPIIKNGKRHFIITTSLDNVIEYNIERHLYKEGGFYQFPKNGAKYFIDTFTNKRYEPGETIKVENSMFFKAIN